MSSNELFWNHLLIDFGRFVILVTVIPIIVALFNRKEWNRPLFIFFLYCLLTCFLNLFETLFIWATGAYTSFFMPFLEYWNITNTLFLHIFTGLKNFLLLSLFYSLIFPNSKTKEGVKIIGYFLSAIFTINYLFFEGFREIGVINPTINAVFIVVLPLVYLWFSRHNTLRIPLRKSPYFWISLGLFLPNFVGLFFYFTADIIMKYDFSFYCQMQIFKNGFEVLGQFLLAIGFRHSYYSRFV